MKKYAAAIFVILNLISAKGVNAAVEKTTEKTKMPVAFWEDVSQCETRQNWTDGGNYSGGLGIAQSTWVNYGGREFASSPSKATKEQQIIVAHRISVTGFQTRHTFMSVEDIQNNKPFFRPPVGYFGWGCIKQNNYLHPLVWKRNNPKYFKHHHGKKL